jgi:hypothetical protein
MSQLSLVALLSFTLCLAKRLWRKRRRKCGDEKLRKCARSACGFNVSLDQLGVNWMRMRTARLDLKKESGNKNSRM